MTSATTAGGTRGARARGALLACGYGLFLTFYYACAQWSISPLSAANSYAFFHEVMRWSVACGFLASFAWGVRSTGGSGRGLRACGGAVLACALALYAGVLAGVLAGPLAACASAVALGFSAALLNACWVRAFAGVGSRPAKVALAASAVVTGALWAGVTLVVCGEPVASFAFFAACALGSFALLVACARGAVPLCVSSRPPVHEGLPRMAAAFAGLAPVFACCLVVPLLQPLAGMMLQSQGMDAFSHALAWSLGEVAAGAALLVVWLACDLRADAVRLFRMAVPVVATVAVLFPFLGDAYWPVFFVLSEVLRTMMLVAAIASCLEAALRAGIDAAVPYGALALLMFTADLVGCALGPLIVSLTPDSTDRARLIGVLFAFVLVAIFMVLYFMRRRGSGGEARATAPAGPPPADAAPSARVFELAARFGLSPRETEVLALQARGRNVPFIAEELGVSPATVRSHVKRIHQALGVHTQQELIDLVERARLGDSA